jgi:transcriptional antiterminator RfaH
LFAVGSASGVTVTVLGFTDLFAVLTAPFHVPKTVEITEGPFRGLEVVVTRLLPAKERVRVLFEFLGRSVEMEISTAKVLAA